MFDLDLGKVILFGLVTLVFVGPKELPQALRLAGRVFGTARRLRAQMQGAVEDFMSEAKPQVDPIALALNPATAMRASVGGPSASCAPMEAMDYASPEMRAYLGVETEEPRT